MATVPEILPRTIPEIIASYDYTDFEDGTGIVVYYAGGTRDSSGVKYHLDRNTYQSSWEDTDDEDRFLRDETSSGTFAEVFNIDFDAGVFQTPRTLQGTMISQIPVAINHQHSNNQGDTYVIMTIYHYDGSTETQIAQTQSNTFVCATGVSETKVYFVIKTTIPRTRFKIGDNIRITVQLYAKKNAGTSNPAFMLAFDPLNQVITAENGTGTSIQRLNVASGYSQMAFNIPFRIFK